MKKAAIITALLAITGGFVDTAGFLGFKGLFLSHVTGNFVTLGAALVLGGHGIIDKILALPEFILVVALARLVGDALRRADAPVLRVLLATEALLLLAFLALAIAFGPFDNPDRLPALAIAFVGVAAMAVQNALQRVHLGDQPPSTIMTGNTTQATLDGIDLILGHDQAHLAQTRARFLRIVLSIVYFAAGCAAGAILFWYAGFWCLVLPVLLVLAAAQLADEKS
jgi:uncharacterized membrane protein YoaK (UPF0700 family)